MLESLSFLAAAGTDSDAGLVGQFGINGKVIFAQVVNFIVVGFLLWRFAYKPVMETLEERQTKIADGLKFAEEAKQQLVDAEARQKEVLREANREAQKILHEARESSKAFEDKMKKETSRQIEDMRRRAEESNELERLKMLSEVRKEIARLVVLTSGKVLQRELQDSERERLNTTAMEEIARLN